MSGSTKSTKLAGIVISVLVIGTVGSIGYFQLQVAPQVFATQSTTVATTSSGLPPLGQYVNVTIPSGASGPPANYTQGAKTQYGFTPDIITVVIGKNNTIIWNNDDVALHTATSDTAGVFDTGPIAPGSFAQVTLTTPGNYTYHCDYHAWMQGTIIVKAG